MSGRDACFEQGLAHTPAPMPAPMCIGRLLAIGDEGRTPLVVFEGQAGSAALPARSTVDLRAEHVGAQVLLAFAGEGRCPVVTGVLRDSLPAWPAAELPPAVSVDADGQRLLVSAGEQLVLRCGKASITLTRAGKVLIQGSYVLSRSTGANRIKGGSVQIN